MFPRETNKKLTMSSIKINWSKMEFNTSFLWWDRNFQKIHQICQNNVLSKFFVISYLLKANTDLISNFCLEIPEQKKKHFIIQNYILIKWCVDATARVRNKRRWHWNKNSRNVKLKIELWSKCWNSRANELQQFKRRRKKKVAAATTTKLSQKCMKDKFMWLCLSVCV